MEFEKIGALIEGKWKNIEYYCYCKEVGKKTHTPHLHIFIKFVNPVYGKSILKLFVGAHLDMCVGTCQENRDYIYKSGKWENSEKEDTRLEGMQFENGECPIERPGKRNDLEELKNLLLAGKTNAEIYNTNASYMRYASSIDRIRQDLINDKYKNEWRDLEVTYIHGTTGTGKTRGVMEQYGYANVYRVTDYQHPFDSYGGQDVIVFEEFRSSLKIQDMLNYLDGYPIVLPCRYNNKQACFHKVFIISNWSLTEQFASVQGDYPETWQAFLRRIHHIKVYDNNEITIYHQGIDNNSEYNFFADNDIAYMKKKDKPVPTREK